MKLTSFFVIILSLNAFGQIGVNADADDHIYEQNFDDVYPPDVDDNRDSGEDHSWISNSTLFGWYAAGEFDQPSYFNEYRISEGDETSNSKLYSLGPNKSDPNATDRALGFYTGGTSENTALAVNFKNTGLQTINSVSIHVSGEQWTTMGGCSKGQQRIKIGYLVANDISLTLSDGTDGPILIMGDDFANIEEAVLINRDTTSSNQILNGNITQNRSIISLTFPVSIPAGSEILIRFYDEEISCGNTDPPIAIDDLTLVFSKDVIATTINPSTFSALSDHNISIAEYLSQGIAKNIIENPDDHPEPGFPVYIAPTNSQYTDWTTILTDFFVNQNFANVASAVTSHGYEMIEYPKDGDPSNPYRVLRKTPQSTNYWGTFVVNPNAGVSNFAENLNLQAPHAANDSDTGIQGASVLMHTDAFSYVMAGADRCSNNTETGCRGGGKCNDGVDDYHSTADLAHDSFNLMDLSMRIIASNNNTSQFIQLHGFGNDGRPFNFVISNGTDQSPERSVDDFAFKLANELESIDPSQIPERSDPFDARVPHKGDADVPLKGFTNNQGKWLNNIEDSDFDPCNDGNSDIANGRFVHLEQYEEIRKKHEMHILLSNAILSALDVLLPVELIEFTANVDINGKVILQWVVGSEVNHSHYEIERSQNGIEFTKISAVAEPKSKIPLSYEYIDNTAPNQLIYYRVKQLDVDGSFSFFPIKLVDKNQPDFIFYPNPANGFLNIRTDHNDIFVLSIDGSKIPVKVISNTEGLVQIDIRHIPNGTYFLIVSGKSYKLIKD